MVQKTTIEISLQLRDFLYEKSTRKGQSYEDIIWMLIGNKEILKLIDKDIEYQKTKLVGDFEKDKPIKWRIVGFKNLRSRITKESKR